MLWSLSTSQLPVNTDINCLSWTVAIWKTSERENISFFKMQSSVVEKQPDLWNYGSANSNAAVKAVKQGTYIQMIFLFLLSQDKSPISESIVKFCYKYSLLCPYRYSNIRTRQDRLKTIIIYYSSFALVELNSTINYVTQQLNLPILILITSLAATTKQLPNLAPLEKTHSQKLLSII